ncbi:MAG: hypothetical protein Q7S92_00505 [Candidatus Diapherotrites archaeon]|nr:hypothetical protein [Candidatus Diapherotrites archaeon]
MIGRKGIKRFITSGAKPTSQGWKGGWVGALRPKEMLLRRRAVQTLKPKEKRKLKNLVIESPHRQTASQGMKVTEQQARQTIEQIFEKIQEKHPKIHCAGFPVLVKETRGKSSWSFQQAERLAIHPILITAESLTESEQRTIVNEIKASLDPGYSKLAILFLTETEFKERNLKRTWHGGTWREAWKKYGDQAPIEEKGYDVFIFAGEIIPGIIANAFTQ